MRHGNKNNNLSRTASHRRALLMNLGCQLITYKRITTTLAKAKALRTYIEPLITKTKATETKESIMHNHRIVFSYLNDKAAVKELFTVVAPKVVGRPGGYTRIIKLGARTGDNAELAMIELVDFNDIYNNNATTGTEKTKRTRRSGGAAKKATTETAVASTTEETPATEETTADDLTLIEGVGPKGAEALAAGGLATFAAIAAATPEEISAVLEAADGSFNSMVPTSWPEQAQLAADGKFEELEALKDSLKGGREA